MNDKDNFCISTYKIHNSKTLHILLNKNNRCDQLMMPHNLSGFFFMEMIFI